MTRYLYDRFGPGLDPTPRLIPLQRVSVPRLWRLGQDEEGYAESFDPSLYENPLPDGEGDTFEMAPEFVWPIQPPPTIADGQGFTAKLPSGNPHHALDMGTGGDQVLAAAAGTVTFSTATGDVRGNAIVIDHGDGWTTRYYHLDQRLVEAGTVVSAGQPIGVAGKTGLMESGIPHLHFAVYWGETAIDPLVVLGGAVALPDEPGWVDEAFAFMATEDPGTDIGAGVGLVALALAGAAGLIWWLK